MNESNRNQPYRLLGKQLKRSREKRSESLLEASGAVEIDTDVLEKIENGQTRPSEEILLLLISHFNINEEEAGDLWELAGYSGDQNDRNTFDADQIKQAFVMPMDIRVVYTDMVNIVANDFGVVMNFIQNAGPNSQPLAVARVGMSREHARSMLALLEQTLGQVDRVTAPKAITAPKVQKSDKD